MYIPANTVSYDNTYELHIYFHNVLLDCIWLNITANGGGGDIYITCADAREIPNWDSRWHNDCCTYDGDIKHHICTQHLERKKNHPWKQLCDWATLSGYTLPYKLHIHVCISSRWESLLDTLNGNKHTHSSASDSARRHGNQTVT